MCAVGLSQERLGKDGLDAHSQFIFDHVAPACANLCRALGDDFSMFLPVVLPPLLSALEAEVKFNIEAADPDEENQASGYLCSADADASHAGRGVFVDTGEV